MYAKSVSGASAGSANGPATRAARSTLLSATDSTWGSATPTRTPARRDMTPEALKDWRSRLADPAGRSRRLSQSGAAQLLRVSLRTYQDWETGKTAIPGPVGLACAAIERGLPPVE